MRFGDADPPCAADPAAFFSTNPARREQAKGMCATCPFADPCRELSETPIHLPDSTYTVRNGVWAGIDRSDAEDLDILSPKQRQTRDRVAEMRVLLSEGMTRYQIGKKMGLGSGSVNNLYRYIEEAV